MTRYSPALSEETRIGLIIEPLDTLFFRDGRPFGAGDTGRGGLPTPQTLYGMVRRFLRIAAGTDHKPVHNARLDPENWDSWVAVRGPWPARVSDAGNIEDVYMPPPCHLMTEKNGDKSLLLSPMKDALPGWEPPRWDGQAPLHPLVAKDANGKLEPADGLLTLKGLAHILAGKPTGNLVRPDNLYGIESRTGIAIDPERGTAADGMLYSAHHLRLESNIAFYAEVGMETGQEARFDDLRKCLPSDAITLPFGGEGRRVRIQVADKPVAWPQPAAAPAHDEGGFTTILITPAILGTREGTNAEAWHPPHVAALRAAAIGKPLCVSGWRLPEPNERTGGTPKPTRHAVSAGSVYFWQNGRHADPERSVPNMMQLTTQMNGRAQGWGLALRGIWRWN